MSADFFALRGLTKHHGGLCALDGLDLELRRGELVGLIGPNGAGKTTCFNLITGADEPSSGSIRLSGRELVGTRACERVALGVARTFQNIRLWSEMSVLDNVRAVCRGEPHRLLDALLRRPAFRRAERAATEQATALLERLELAPLADREAGSLAYGDQRRLEIARALALRPALLLLDEPAAGMNPSEKLALVHCVGRLRHELDLTVLLIEHDMEFVMGACERIYVLDHGLCIFHGTPAEVRASPVVIEAYLGSET